MKEIKIFELNEANPSICYQIMSIIAGRCAGKETDPDSGEGWDKYENIDISIIRSTKPISQALENHNVVSDLTWEFTVKELADDYSSDDTIPEISDIGHEVVKLPIGRTSSHFFIKVELS